MSPFKRAADEVESRIVAFQASDLLLSLDFKQLLSAMLNLALGDGVFLGALDCNLLEECATADRLRALPVDLGAVASMGQPLVVVVDR